MWGKRSVSLLGAFIIVLSLCSILSGEEYIAFRTDSSGRSGSPGLYSQENSIIKSLDSMGIKGYEKKTFFSNLGMLCFHAPQWEIDQLAGDNDLVIVPAHVQLYPSYAVSQNDLNISDVPWHLQVSLPLYQYVSEEEVDFSSVRVFVIDTGVQVNHPQLQNKLDLKYAKHFFETYSGDEFTGIESDDIVSDFDGHGTLVTGVISGSSTGVSPETLVVPIKASNSEGTMTIFALAAAIDHVIGLSEGALDSTRLIVNLSFNSSPGEDETLEAFFDSILVSLSESGVLFLSSAGNGLVGTGINVDSLPVYPTYNENPNFLSVGSVNETGFLDLFSNYGETTVEIAAPGSSILTTNNDSSLAEVDGTSFASPFAAGIASMIWGLDPDLVYWQVRNLLIYAVRGREVQDNFIDEYAGTSPEFLFLSSSLLYDEAYGTLPLSVISGKALYPGAITGDDSDFVTDGGGGCNFLPKAGLLWMLIPLVTFLTRRRDRF